MKKYIISMVFVAMLGVFGGASFVYAAPSITLTSPNGGENWQPGKSYTITWDQQNVDKLTIYLMRTPSLVQDTIISNYTVSINASVGSYTYNVPANTVGAGTYKIWVVAYQTGIGSVSDWSDNVFSVTSGTSPTSVLPLDSTKLATPYTKWTLGVTDTTAKLYGVVNPNNNDTYVWFSLSAAQGTPGVQDTPLTFVSAQNALVDHKATVTGLQPDTEYSWNFKAKTGTGTVIGYSYGFKTSPSTSPTPTASTITPSGVKDAYTLGNDMYISWTPTLPGVSTIQLVPLSGNTSDYYQIYGMKVQGNPVNTAGNLTYKLPKFGINPGKYYLKFTPTDGSPDAISDIFTIQGKTVIPSSPTISYFTPTYGPTGSNVSIYGSLGGVTSVVFTDLNAKGGVDYAINFFKGDSTGIGVSLPANMPASTYSIVVKTLSSSAQATGTFTVTATPPTAPTITLVVPSLAKVGDLVSIYGSSFDSGSYINFVGTNVTAPPLYYASNLLKFTVPLLAPGVHTINVGKKASNVTSNSVNFTIIGPTKSSIVPSGVKNAYTLGNDMYIFWTPTLPGVSTIQLVPLKNPADYYQIYGMKVQGNPVNTKGNFTYKLPEFGINSGKYYLKFTPTDGSPDAISGIFTIQGKTTTTPQPPTIAPLAITPPTSTMFTRNIWMGLRGDDVKRLQQLFNSNPNTRIAEFGAGSPGNETDYFGFITQSAVQNFQCKYGVVCSGTPDSTGYGVVGPKTRIKLQEVFGVNNTTNTTPITPIIPTSTATKPTQPAVSLQQQIQQALEQIKILQQQISELQ